MCVWWAVQDAPVLHLAYHGQEHYNSVRLQEDFGNGPPAPIVFRKGADLKQVQAAAQTEAHKQVRRATGCSDDAAVTAALCNSAGNIDEVRARSY